MIPVAEPPIGSAAPPRGELKIFFGYAPVVGKTYTMLEAARTATMAGRDVVVGCIEPHGRPATRALVLGLDVLTPARAEHQGFALADLDLPAALARHPQILVVDDLAHTNGAHSRHPKRWQDVRELLDHGIDVWTTLDVQHLDSLSDVVRGIGGAPVCETVPDHVFDEAAHVELVDLPPEELLERQREGPGVAAGQAAQTEGALFEKAQLIALREVAMRRLADRVGREVLAARRARTVQRSWPTRDRLLVCVGASPTSAKVIRTARRMATRLHAEWIAVHARTLADPSPADAERVARHLELARRLGAETVTIAGADVAAEIVHYAQSRNATQIVIGKTASPRGLLVWRRSVVDRLVERSGEIDVLVVRGDPSERGVDPPSLRRAARRTPSAYALAAGVILVATFVASLFAHLRLSDANLVMTYLVGVVVVAARLGRAPAALAALLAVLAFNFFFTPPYYTFVVDDSGYLYTFAVMLLVALVIGSLTSRVRDQAHLARALAGRTEALFRVSRRLAGTTGRLQIAAAAREQLDAMFAGGVAVYVSTGDHLETVCGVDGAWADDPLERETAQWACAHAEAAGLGTDTLPNARALHVPLPGPQAARGAIAWRPRERSMVDDPDLRRLLESVAALVSLALERDRLAQEASRVLALAEGERARSGIVAAVSHDLRTPIAAIAGSASALLDAAVSDATVRRELLQAIADEADRMARLVENLLYLTRIEAGRLELARAWQPIDECVATAVRRVERGAPGGREAPAIDVDVPAGLPLVEIDGLLVELALINLLENARKYSSVDSRVDLVARRAGSYLELSVLDRGPGVPPEERDSIFEAFRRGERHRADRTRGSGLGLAICHGIALAHGGTVVHAPRDGGGSRFTLALPIGGGPPASSSARDEGGPP